MFPDIGSVHGRLLLYTKEILLYVGENMAEGRRHSRLESGSRPVGWRDVVEGRLVMK